MCSLPPFVQGKYSFFKRLQVEVVRKFLFEDAQTRSRGRKPGIFSKESKVCSALFIAKESLLKEALNISKSVPA